MLVSPQEFLAHRHTLMPVTTPSTMPPPPLPTSSPEAPILTTPMPTLSHLVPQTAQDHVTLHAFKENSC